VPRTDPDTRPALHELVLGAASLLVAAVGVALLSSGWGTAPTALALTGSSLPVDAVEAVADELGWELQAVTVAGAGFARNVDRSSRTLETGLEEGAGGSYDVVLVQGGEADNPSSGRELRTAAGELLQRLAGEHPDAILVVVGPIPGVAVPDSLLRVNHTLRNVAAEHDARYIDALSAGWRDSDTDLADRLRLALDDLDVPGAVGD
jgi:hypothetical protein